MPGVSKEQIARATEWDLLSYLQRYEPDELVRTGPHEYSTVTHGSLKISNGKWHWFKGEMGGKTALSYLVHVRNMGFVEAVELLSDGIGRAPPPLPWPTEPPKPFRLPEAARFPTHVLSYLQQRGIGGDILRACIEAGVLYESKRYHITRFNLQSVSLERNRIDLSVMLRQTADEFYPILEEKNLTLSENIESGIQIIGDADKLERAFDNVIRNAISYSYPDTCITISAKATDENVTMAVRNSGDEIPPEKISRIFEKFFRTDSARGSRTGGAGLGLAIAKQIVELHGGTITAVSNPDFTEFTITLPIQ